MDFAAEPQIGPEMGNGGPIATYGSRCIFSDYFRSSLRAVGIAIHINPATTAMMTRPPASNKAGGTDAI